MISYHTKFISTNVNGLWKQAGLEKVGTMLRYRVGLLVLLSILNRLPFRVLGFEPLPTVDRLIWIHAYHPPSIFLPP